MQAQDWPKKDERLDDIRVLDSGYCIQTEYLTGRPNLTFRRFHAMFLYFRHSRHGEAVIDTGYSHRFFRETRRWPGILHRIATPVPKHQNLTDGAFFTRHRISPGKIKTVFLSHFHADHIAGLHHFPKARIISHADAVEDLNALTVHQTIKAGMLTGLLPDDFDTRSILVHGTQFSKGPAPLEAFSAVDFWGDGSLWIIDLPGHAQGHVGFLLNTDHGKLFYAADAYWDLRVLRDRRPLPRFSMQFQHNGTAYEHTQQKLRRLDREIQSQQLLLKMYATHCPETFANRWRYES